MSFTTLVPSQVVKAELGDFSEQYFDEILEKVVLKLRLIIVGESRQVRQELLQQRRQQQQEQQEQEIELREYLPPAPTALPAQSASQKQLETVKTAESVFGVSGKNTVRVETSNYNYNYEIQK